MLSPSSLRVPSGWMFLTLLLIAAGCGDSAPAPTTNEAAAGVKSQIAQFVEAARKNPKAADADAGILLESLHARVAEHGNKFQALVTEAEALQKLQQSNAPKADIDAQLDKLEATANQL